MPIQNLLDRRKKVEYRLLTGWWLDTGSPDALLGANRYLLGKFTPAVLGQVLSLPGQRLPLPGEESSIENSQINEEPVYIKAGCQIKDSTISPWVTMGGGGTVTGSDLKNSILFSGAQVENFALHQSISSAGDPLLTGRHRPDQAQAPHLPHNPSPACW